MHILVVDDELDLREILQFNLESEGFEVSTAGSAEEALELLHTSPADHFQLILLDVMMEHMSGFEMAQQLRSEGNEIPIIFLTAKTTEGDQLEGFGAGADDYITKPFSFQTVLARIKAVLKRTITTAPAQEQFHFGELQISHNTNSVLLNGQPIELTRKEYQILHLLAQHAGEHLTREQIMSAVWDDDICVGDRSVDVHIARLRKKLGNAGARITNKTGSGYRFS